ncbi:MAG TPA: NAD(P)H-hydrate dehydratase [Prolixibacteraceae bacterium]|nr:NAD(P)H-hydrate dehydratase [Prolixibacteraceae bacterium]
MKIFETSKISQVDTLTMQLEPISHIDLMERAAGVFANYIINETVFAGNVFVFCGPGNNGGDGLAIARLLAQVSGRFSVHVFLLDFGKGISGAPAHNLVRLKNECGIEHVLVNNVESFPAISSNVMIIDALFGSGLSRPLSGVAAALVNHINSSGALVYSVDIPSGLMGENNDDSNYDAIIKATVTVTFQFPKISFLLPENETVLGKWLVVDIGLHYKAIDQVQSPYFLNNSSNITPLLKQRSKFAHKGVFGHALLIAGAYGKMGAAALAAQSCLRSGVGLLTVHVPHLGYQIIQTSVPEAMTSIDESDLMFTSVENIETYNAVGVGPGIGTKVNTQRALKKLIELVKKPMVLDADALNILSMNSDWLELMPSQSVITPHPKEFDRLCGNSETSFGRLKKAIAFAQKHKLIIVLKGANTQIIEPDGTVWFNTTGNNGMATAGSGDVLSGIILALLAQGYLPAHAARLGVYLHGLAGDYAYREFGAEALIASDIINNIGNAFKELHHNLSL